MLPAVTLPLLAEGRLLEDVPLDGPGVLLDGAPAAEFPPVAGA
jgi:hypothetical protein